MKKIILIFFIILSTILSAEEYVSGKIIERLGTVKENNLITDMEFIDGEMSDIVVYEIKVGKDIINVESPIYNESSLNIDFKKGDRVILMKDTYEDGKIVYFITDTDKRMNYVILSSIFIILTIILAKIKGIKALLALGIGIASIFYFFLPFVIKGYSPILLSVITALFSSIITIYFITGFNKKGITAVLGSIGGVLCSGVLSAYFVNNMGLTGFSTVDAVGYVGILGGIKVKELISAGIILGSMGAVMDVSMSISSSIAELKETNPNLSPWKTFISGINIGQDIVGTMINTLILAYIGGSLFDMLIILIHIKDLPLERLLNFEFIAIEILKSFSGSIGILIAIPITAYLSSYMGTGKNIFNDKKENSK